MQIKVEVQWVDWRGECLLFLVFGYWFLVIGFWLLVFGYWLLVIGFWFLVFGFWFRVRGSGFGFGVRVRGSGFGHASGVVSVISLKAALSTRSSETTVQSSGTRLSFIITKN
jgi:hypothetical protein